MVDSIKIKFKVLMTEPLAPVTFVDEEGKTTVFHRLAHQLVPMQLSENKSVKTIEALKSIEKSSSIFLQTADRIATSERNELFSILLVLVVMLYSMYVSKQPVETTVALSLVLITVFTVLIHNRKKTRRIELEKPYIAFRKAIALCSTYYEHRIMERNDKIKVSLQNFDRIYNMYTCIVYPKKNKIK